MAHDSPISEGNACGSLNPQDKLSRHLRPARPRPPETYDGNECRPGESYPGSYAQLDTGPA